MDEAPTLTRPAQLPPDIVEFTGRTEQAAWLARVLACGDRAGPVRVAAIIGAGGLGKSALVVHVAHQLRTEFPDGQLFIELRGSGEEPVSSGVALARLLRHLGLSDAAIPRDDAECAAEFRSRTADRRMLIVLDDACDAAQVRPLLPGTGSSAVLITSRSRLTDLEGCQALTLDALDDEQALALFADLCGPERVAAEPAATRVVLAACAGLPQVVRIAASRLASRPGWNISALANRLGDELDDLQVGDFAVRASFEFAPFGPSGGAVSWLRSDPVVPRQLPGAAAHFVGRATELAALVALWDQAGTGRTVVISAITGTAGIGKTALAVHFARQFAGRFPDGQLYADLQGFGPAGTPVTPAEAIRRFLNGLGVAPERIPVDAAVQADLYRNLLAGKRALIVLDNARDPAQVRPLLPGSPGCMVLVTSRSQLTGLAAADGANLLALDVLTEPEARALLESRLGPRRVRAEPAVVTELTGLCSRLPLALSIAAARAAARPGLPLAALAAELRTTQTRLDALGTGDAATDVRTVFSWSYQQLSGPSARMFRLLGVHPGPDITAAAAASLAGVSLPQARHALAELATANLATEHAPSRFTCHDLLRAYAGEQARSEESDTSRRDATLRVLDHYLHTADSASRLLHPHRPGITLKPPQPPVRPEEPADRQQALAWFQAERLVLLATISQAADAGFSTHAWQLPWAVATFFSWHGHWRELEATQRSALAAARRLGDLVAQAEAYRHLGLAQARLGAYGEASTHLAASAELGRQLGDCAAQARAHGDLARAFELQGRAHDALSHAEQMLRLYHAAGQRPGEANALNQVGWHHAQLGRYQQALDYCEQALALHRELGNSPGEAPTLDSLGYAHYHLGHHAEAIECYKQAIDVHGEAGDLHNRAEFLTHLGDAYRAATDPQAAYRAWQEALAILDALHDPAAAQVRSRLGHHHNPAEGMPVTREVIDT